MYTVEIVKELIEKRSKYIKKLSHQEIIRTAIELSEHSPYQYKKLKEMRFNHIESYTPLALLALLDELYFTIKCPEEI